MFKTDISQDAAAVLGRNAVTFETDRRYNNQSAWPFFYSFVPKVQFDTNQLNNKLGQMGIKIPSGQIRDIPIRLERDTVYRQINVKYAPYKVTLGDDTGETGTTSVGSKALASSDGTAFSVGQAIAWVDDLGKIRDGVIRRINTNNLILEEAAVSVATGVKLFERNYSWYETPATPYTGTTSALTGTIAIAANQAPSYGEGFAVVGVGTAFDTELQVGETIITEDSEGATIALTVENITDATNMRVTNRLAEDVEVFAGTSFNLSGRYLDSTGTISIAGGGNAVVGVGTLFTTEYAVGDLFKVIDDSGQERIFLVGSITNNLNMTITETLAASDGVTAQDFQQVGSGITGTITASSSSKVVTGAGTSFTTEVAQGDILPIAVTGGAVKYVIVEKVLSNTLLYATTYFSDALGVAQVAGVATVNSSYPRTLLNVRPLTQFLKVSYIMTSLRGRYLYGGVQTFIAPDTNESGMKERPLLIQSLQGERDGLGQLRTPSLFPYEAVVTIRIHNTYSEDVVVNGSLFGYKISLGGV